ncbi:MAG: carboxylesterase/lipase family protein [Dehalococcoidia bacterium]
MTGPVVETRTGKLLGRLEGDVFIFRGIPYAAPPTGPRRFQAPAPVPPWTGIRDAIEYGPSCPQMSARPAGWSQEPSLSEDCLYLNVWSSGITGDTRRPVMVWFHGGGFSIGSGSWPVYDGRALARRGDVVVVTVNHRLGIFGYLHLGELAGDEFVSSGDAGMLDLVAALSWVRDNIEAFGGDANNVMIFGESGGGAKVSTLLAMPAAAGLFHRAAVQSGPGLRVRQQKQATESAAQLLAGLQVDARDHGALAALSTEHLLDAQAKRGRMSFADFSPVLDGVTVADHPGAALSNGTAHDVPMIIGCNRDEATLFLAMNPSNSDLDALDEAGLRRRVAPYGKDADRVVDAYRAARPDASPRDLYVAMESDRMMRLPSIELAERKLTGGGTSVFMYLFCWAAGPLGSAHGYEIPFVFDNARPPVMPESPTRAALAAQMSDAWISFARGGEPSHEGLPRWPEYAPADRATMIFDAGECQLVADPFAEGRLAWQGSAIPTGISMAAR